jgi:Ala-tRNA(Pro) deacylase
MTAKRLKDFLDREGVKYETIAHSPAYTARDTAQAAHVQGKDFAKTLIVKIDGRLAMAVLPAPEKLDLAQLKKAAGAKHVSLAFESEFERWFPGCEPGAMPPFGNLYGMEVFVAKSLAADEQIAFNAGSHAELVRTAYKDFERLVQPIMAVISTPSRPVSKVESA